MWSSQLVRRLNLPRVWSSLIIPRLSSDPKLLQQENLESATRTKDTTQKGNIQWDAKGTDACDSLILYPSCHTQIKKLDRLLVPGPILVYRF